MNSSCRQLQTLATAFMAECGPWPAAPRLTDIVGSNFLTKLILGPLTRLRNRCVHVDNDLIHWCRFLVNSALNVSDDPLELDSLANMITSPCGMVRLMPPRPRLCVFRTATPRLPGTRETLVINEELAPCTGVPWTLCDRNALSSTICLTMMLLLFDPDAPCLAIILFPSVYFTTNGRLRLITFDPKINAEY